MSQLNQINLLGNLTRDPEMKYTNEGTAICEMGIAVGKKWIDKEGKESESVDFFNITCWNTMAENCAASLKKGDRVLLNGHMNLRSWENKEGKKFNIINITADTIAASLEFNKIIYDNANTDFLREDLEGKSGKKKEKQKI
ncbi:MAG: single-stranded DNA-binding protein [Actinomycetia bacterium]|nr:single-stranded DNA-binding protein [Actinomycetes bacterium]